jgi:hypothetical protein
VTLITETDDSTTQGGESDTTVALGKGVDWLVAALLVSMGVSVAVFGGFLNAAANRADIAALVAEGTIQSTTLSDAELADISHALAWWGGVGLAAVGLLLVIGGVVFFACRRRERTRRPKVGIAGPNTMTNAIIGATVSVVVFFVPLSPVLDGLVTGSLQKGAHMDGIRVGGLAGLVAAALIALLFASLITGLFGAPTAVGVGFEGGLMTVAPAVAATVLTLYLVVLSAVDGYFGVYLDEHRGQPHEDDQAPTA